MDAIYVFIGGAIGATLAGEIAHRAKRRWIAAPLFLASIVLGLGAGVAVWRTF
jgi:surfactin synthase thioesterase subunit